MTDLALVIAAVSLTAALCLVVFYFHSRGRRRQLERVRAQRLRWYTEARELRADRPAVYRTLAEHAATVVVDAPIAHTLADPSVYRPVFASDSPIMREYLSTAELIRRAGTA